MIIDITDFDIATATGTGGATGSKRVKNSKTAEYYQLKSPIKDQSLARKLKVRITSKNLSLNERENFGEVISCKIGRALHRHESSDAVADAFLVHDSKNKKVFIASKYLKGKKVQSLDDYAKASGVSFKRHASFVNKNPANLMPGEFNLAGEQNKQLRKDLADIVALSAIVGDHDINPGNIMMVDGRLCRIDFGHAFNDLLNSFAKFGGQVRNKENSIIDFFNREYVAGSKPPGGKSKLWRDYPGIIPSKEMAESLSEMASQQGINSGILEAKNDFLELVKKAGAGSNLEKHILTSLKEINKAIGAENIDSKIPTQQAIDIVFGNIEKFCKENQKQMRYAAQLMSLQNNIDEIIKLGDNASAKDIDKARAEYQKLSAGKSIEWFKTMADEKAFTGKFNEYVTYRQKQIQAKPTATSITKTVKNIQDGKLVIDDDFNILDEIKSHWHKQFEPSSQELSDTAEKISDKVNEHIANKKARIIPCSTNSDNCYDIDAMIKNKEIPQNAIINIPRLNEQGEAILINGKNIFDTITIRNGEFSPTESMLFDNLENAGRSLVPKHMRVEIQSVEIAEHMIHDISSSAASKEIPNHKKHNIEEGRD